MPTQLPSGEVVLTPEELQRIRDQLALLPGIRASIIKARQAGINVDEQVRELEQLEAKARQLLAAYSPTGS